jgi:hypothetical protein
MRRRVLKKGWAVTTTESLLTGNTYSDGMYKVWIHYDGPKNNPFGKIPIVYQTPPIWRISKIWSRRLEPFCKEDYSSGLGFIPAVV